VITYTVAETGWLWQNPDLEAVLLPAVSAATNLVLADAEHRVGAHRGPGRYGHAADALGAEVGKVEGAGIVGRVIGRGPAAFKLRFLNWGTKQHPIPRVRGRRGTRKILKFAGGEVFRRYVWHPGEPGIQFTYESQRATAPAVYELLDRAVGDYVGR